MESYGRGGKIVFDALTVDPFDMIVSDNNEETFGEQEKKLPLDVFVIVACKKPLPNSSSQQLLPNHAERKAKPPTTLLQR